MIILNTAKTNYYNSFSQKKFDKDFNSQKNSFELKPLSYKDEIDFTRKELSNSEFSVDDFINKYKKYYGQKNFSEIIKNIVSSPESFINKGAKNITFSIPKIDNYIIRMPLSISKDIRNRQLGNLKPITDYYKSLNIGQPILESDDKIQICKKQHGLPIRACDWYVLKNNPKVITPELAANFLNDMESLASFPLSSYREIVKVLKKIDKHQIDYLNSNNFLIDKENQKIGRVDITDIKTDKVLPCTKEDIIFPLINILVHSYIREVMNNDEKTRLDEATKEIIEKCNIVAKEEGLIEDRNFPYDFWRNKITEYLGKTVLQEVENDIKLTKDRYLKEIYPNEQ